MPSQKKEGRILESRGEKGEGAFRVCMKKRVRMGRLRKMSSGPDGRVMKHTRAHGHVSMVKEQWARSRKGGGQNKCPLGQQRQKRGGREKDWVSKERNHEN